MAAALGGGHEASNRAFGIAVLVSIVAHAALLVAFPGFRESKKSSIVPGPITARLVSPSSAVAPPAPKPEEARQPKVEETPAPPAPIAKPVPAPVAKPSPVAKAAQAAPAAPAAAPSAAPSKPASEPVAAAPAAPAATGPVARVDPQPTAPAPSADEAGTLAQYRLAIITAARRYKRYPRVAMDNNWEGRVEIRMVIGANGMIASLSIKTSAGHEVLDQQALDMIKKAKPLTPIPAALRGREFAVDVPVIFSLKEEASG